MAAITVRSVCGSVCSLPAGQPDETVWQLKGRLLTAAAGAAEGSAYLAGMGSPADLMLLHCGNVMRDDLGLHAALPRRPRDAAQLVMVRKRTRQCAAGAGQVNLAGEGPAARRPWSATDAGAHLMAPGGPEHGRREANAAQADTMVDLTEGDSMVDLSERTVDLTADAPPADSMAGSMAASSAASGAAKAVATGGGSADDEWAAAQAEWDAMEAELDAKEDAAKSAAAGASLDCAAATASRASSPTGTAPAVAPAGPIESAAAAAAAVKAAPPRGSPGRKRKAGPAAGVGSPRPKAAKQAGRRAASGIGEVAGLVGWLRDRVRLMRVIVSRSFCAQVLWPLATDAGSNMAHRWPVRE